MKKTLTAVALLAGAMTGYSQGLVEFNLNASPDKEPVFNAQASDALLGTPVSYGGYSVNETLGNSGYAHSTPTGTTVYTGAALSGTGYDFEILVGAAGSTLSQLTPFGGSTSATAVVANFNTGAASIGYANAGASIALPANLATGAGVTVDVAFAAWNNEGGTVNTLLQAQKNDNATANSDPWGISNEVTYTTALVGGGQEIKRDAVSKGDRKRQRTNRIPAR